MTIELPAESSRALSKILKSGGYSSPAEAVAEALGLLQKLLSGVHQVRERKLKPFDEATARRIKARGRRMLASERRAKRASGR